jgi:PAS domain S-box-containing protein
MATELMKALPSKTQTILLAETKAERWIAWVRLGCAAVLAIIFLPSWILNKNTTQATLVLQASATGLLAVSSACYLFYTRIRKRVAKFFLYSLTFIDVLTVTAIICSSITGGPVFVDLPAIAFGAYFIVIAFTSFHHRVSLALFSGIASAIGYTVFSWIQMAASQDPGPTVVGYVMRVALLLFAATLSMMISRKNYQTVRKVLSTELRYDTLVDRLPEMIFTLDAKGNFLWSNKACTMLLGVTPEKLVGMSIHSFLKRPELLHLEKTGIKATLELLDSRGERKYVDCIAQRVTQGISEVSFDGLMTDITDRELAILQREEMVDRLFQYQKMESIGSLASGMAHDFNNILQTIVDVSTMVSKESNEPETKKRIELILETTADARFLISELLALGRKKLLDYRHVELEGFFTPLIAQFQKQLGVNYKLRLDLPKESLKIQGDPDYLKRVFQNLFGNARDAMPAGGSITVSCTSMKSRGGSGIVIIRVTDTGSGIPSELTEKIFDPFFTTKKPGKGTGLGLALVRRIVVLHNGKIFVERTGPSGTCFRIEFPLVTIGDTEIDTKSIMLNRIGATIIMLEDDPKIRDIMKFFLKEFDYTILEASTGEEAVAALKANVDKCRVVVTDWKLGGENPHAMIMKLRAIREDTTIIVVSGFPPIAKSIEALKIYRWFTKPYDKNQLDMEIQRGLRGMPPRPI